MPDMNSGQLRKLAQAAWWTGGCGIHLKHRVRVKCDRWIMLCDMMVMMMMTMMMMMIMMIDIYT